MYIFTKTTDWVAYENIQAKIFDHLLAIAPVFELRVFQDPTGLDFSTLVKWKPSRFGIKNMFGSLCSFAVLGVLHKTSDVFVIIKTLFAALPKGDRFLLLLYFSLEIGQKRFGTRPLKATKKHLFRCFFMELKSQLFRDFSGQNSSCKWQFEKESILAGRTFEVHLVSDDAPTA